MIQAPLQASAFALLAIVDDEGQVLDRVVVNGRLSGDPERQIKMATMNFLANGGSGYPFPFPHSERVDLSGEAVQPNPPNPDFPDSNGNGRIDDPRAVDPGLSDFAASGTEQDALAEYLAHFYSDEPFNEPETSPLHDRRIQNLGLPGMTDTVFDGEPEKVGRVGILRCGHALASASPECLARQSREPSSPRSSPATSSRAMWLRAWSITPCHSGEE